MEFKIGKSIYIKVDEYNGAYSICQGYHDKEDKFAPEMCMKRNWETKDFTDKKAFSVYMGKGDEGKANLCAMAKMILAKYGEADVPEDFHL